MSNQTDPIHVRIDGEVWKPANDETAEYDAIHAAAGAVLAGATEVKIIRQVHECTCGPSDACDICGGH